ncbi:hypothetical protein LDENG_00219670, partial [Lucifuga dentata]
VASCRILRCNSDFVAATLDLGSSSSGVGGGVPSRDAGIEDLLVQHRCPSAGPTTLPRPLPRTLPQVPLSGNACIYEKGLFTREGQPDDLHCSVFGDPHVRTFNNEFQTCAVQGAWPLIDNEYLYIQATSTLTGGGAHGTTLTKITIIFKTWRDCVDQQIYQAELDNVPAAFADGTVWSGERRGLLVNVPAAFADGTVWSGERRGLLVRTQNPGRHAEIQASHIGTVLVVRQSGRLLGLAVRSPRAVVEAFTPDQDLQLCVWGCPASQRLDTLRPPLTASLAGSAARAHCAAFLPAHDVYYQACVFDLLITGDLNASEAAIAALEDARRMIFDSERVHLLPVSSANQHAARPDLTLLLLCIVGVLSGR